MTDAVISQSASDALDAILLSVEDLRVAFRTQAGERSAQSVKAVDGICFAARKGETLALVGESGCGKSTTARAIARLTTSTSGRIEFDGADVLALHGRQLVDYRRCVQMIFQDPLASIDPRYTAGRAIAEPLEVHSKGPRGERQQRTHELLDLVGLRADVAARYPHELSGGELQRVGIARAIALHPRMLIADEPVSALDASIQAQVLNLIVELQREMNLTVIFIAHDLNVVRHVADRVAVMYLGKIAEVAPTEDLYDRPNHPYSQALLSASPVADPAEQRSRTRIVLHGDPPSPVDPPTGCRFHTRCPIAQLPLCADVEPEMREVAEGHEAACHFAAPHPIAL